MAASARKSLLNVGIEFLDFLFLPDIEWWKQLDDVWIMENGMTEIVVTQAVVRKLAAILASTDTTNMRHGDRLDLIASAFGWKTDAFMHALKTVAKEQQASVVSRKEASSVDDTPWSRAVPLRKLGIRLCFSWEWAAEQTHGVLIATGATGSGRSTTLASTAHFLAHQGRVVKRRDDIGRLENREPGHVVLFGAIDDRASADLAYELASRGMLVLASMGRTPISNFRYLSDLGISKERLELTRAVIHQVLVRKLAPGHPPINEATGEKYEGRVLVSAVHEFDAFNTVQKFLAVAAIRGRHFLPDLLEKVKEGVTDVEEVERCFEPYVASCFRRQSP